MFTTGVSSRTLFMSIFSVSAGFMMRAHVQSIERKKCLALQRTIRIYQPNLRGLNCLARNVWPETGFTALELVFGHTIFLILCLGECYLQAVCPFETTSLHCQSAFLNSLTAIHPFSVVVLSKGISSEKVSVLAKMNLKDKTTFCSYWGGQNYYRFFCSLKTCSVNSQEVEVSQGGWILSES